MSGFSNVKGRYRIRMVEKVDDQRYEISLNNDCGTTWVPETNFKFTDETAKPLTIHAVHRLMKEQFNDSFLIK